MDVFTQLEHALQQTAQPRKSKAVNVSTSQVLIKSGAAGRRLVIERVLRDAERAGEISHDVEAMWLQMFHIFDAGYVEAQLPRNLKERLAQLR
jgi:hypothetical protein